MLDLEEELGTATIIAPVASSKHTCRAVTGVDDDGNVKFCGQKVTVLNDWTYECPVHGEMH